MSHLQRWWTSLELLQLIPHRFQHGAAGGCELRRDLDQRPSEIHQTHRRLHPDFHRLDRIAMEWGAILSAFSLRPHLRRCSTGRSLDDSERSNFFGSPAETGRETPRFGSSPPSHGSAPCETFGEMFCPTAWHGLSDAVSRWNPENPVPDWLLGRLSRSGLKAGDRTRTGDVQLGKLTFYH